LDERLPYPRFDGIKYFGVKEYQQQGRYNEEGAGQKNEVVIVDDLQVKAPSLCKRLMPAE
jgi:hypothetical protein